MRRLLSSALGALLTCVSLVAAGVGGTAWAQTPGKVFRDDVTSSALVDALDIGGPAAPDGAATRGFRPATPGAATTPKPAPNPGAGKAPLMITFETGSAELTASSRSILGKVAEALQSDRLAGFAFRVEGHADPRGGEAYNLQLSQERAEAVVRNLVEQHGILAERLTPVGKGAAELFDASHPAAPENRRVTLVTLR